MTESVSKNKYINHRQRRGGEKAQSKRSWTKVRGGRGVKGSRGGTETNRARVKKAKEPNRKEGEKKERARAWQWQSERARECEWKADRKGWIHVEHKRRQTLPPLTLPSLSLSLPRHLLLSLPAPFFHLALHTALYLLWLFIKTISQRPFLFLFPTIHSFFFFFFHHHIRMTDKCVLILNQLNLRSHFFLGAKLVSVLPENARFKRK